MQPWYWRSLPLEHRTGSDIFIALFQEEAISTLLESPYSISSDRPQLAQYSICAGAPRTVNGRLQIGTPPISKVLPFLCQLLAQTASQKFFETQQNYPNHLPFTGGWLGWLGYDLAWEIEKLPQLKSDPLPFPVAYWYEPESFAVLDHLNQTLWLAASKPSQLDILQTKLLRAQCIAPPATPAPPTPPAPSFLTSQFDYETAVRRAKKYIQAGDIFQANLSVRFETQITGDSWRIYRALQQINPSPFASYWRSPWGDVVSCSPERLVKLQNRIAETRPIAGTRARGASKEQDRKLAQEMLTNAKERSEHIMLVDLERNDLGRVCKFGSVNVDQLLTIERYSHVMHLVSNVTGALRSDRSAIDLICAMFPGGTITGCPKVRCMEIIEELEPYRRNLFYGSCGYLDWRGNLDLNILIRTLLVSAPITNTLHRPVWGQVGAGIVADSNPETEWYESLQKAQAQIAALRV